MWNFPAQPQVERVSRDPGAGSLTGFDAATYRSGGFAAIGETLCEYGAWVMSAWAGTCPRPLRVRSGRR
ncbi:hypothetical protein GCM10022416_56610 [Actinomadura keratinilytica]|uniref:Uncharacterized protein n=1 Tax=Actinomadura keratinilytica TaxID=547461 RepID=A0ABP7ZF54_9ACTN